MISILKLADEESCMYMKGLAIRVCKYVRTYIHNGVTNATTGTAQCIHM